MAGALEGEVAIVTGAGVNTGTVIAKTLARAGAAVVVNSRNAAAGARAAVSEIEAAGGRAMAVQGDVTKPGDVERLVAATVAAFGTVSILVNNANLRSYSPLLEITPEAWRDTLAVTLDGSFYCTKACVPHMRKLGRGTIVNIGGSSAHAGRANRCHVAAAKAGLAGMTGALATELAPDNITVNCIVPGRIDTPRPDAVAHAPVRPHRSPMGRSATPQEIANLVRFLCSSECRFMSGAMLHANGAAYVNIG
jgi:NAD(P)-dependent dehydrogenase (short-subunit alcohol dehydrogenase family)